MSTADARGAGFKSLLQQRATDTFANTADGNAATATQASGSPVLAYYRSAMPAEPTALANRVHVPDSPPTINQQYSFQPAGARINRVDSPPSDARAASVQPKLDVVRAGEASPGITEQINRARFRHVRPEDVTEFVKTPDYMAFFDSARCRLEHNFDVNGTRVTQTDMKSFRTRTLETLANGDKVETVRCPAGKPVFTMVRERGGDWEVQEMSYAKNPITGRETWTLAGKRIANSKGEDTQVKYDRGRMVDQTVNPLEIKNRTV
jgi:hypothetical protein